MKFFNSFLGKMINEGTGLYADKKSTEQGFNDALKGLPPNPMGYSGKRKKQYLKGYDLGVKQKIAKKNEWTFFLNQNTAIQKVVSFFTCDEKIFLLQANIPIANI